MALRLEYILPVVYRNLYRLIIPTLSVFSVCPLQRMGDKGLYAVNACTGVSDVISRGDYGHGQAAAAKKVEFLNLRSFT